MTITLKSLFWNNLWRKGRSQKCTIGKSIIYLFFSENVLSDIREADKNQTSTKGAVLWDPTKQSGKPAWNASVLIGQAFSKHNVSIERNGTEVHVSANRTIDSFDLGQRHYRFDWYNSLQISLNFMNSSANAISNKTPGCKKRLEKNWVKILTLADNWEKAITSKLRVAKFRGICSW